VQTARKKLNEHIMHGMVSLCWIESTASSVKDMPTQTWRVVVKQHCHSDTSCKNPASRASYIAKYQLYM
jgi:hypothetical protein